MIFYTIYTSTPIGKVTKEIVDKITEESIKWNSLHGITGMLLCLEDRYFQFLEGEEEDVKEVFEMIKGDPRHNNVTPRIKGYSNERVFSEWSMGSWMLSNEKLQSLSALEDLNEYLQDPVNINLQSKKFVTMMNNILQIWLAHEPERAKRLSK
ncbi:MAG: BLUF domain-containing protein [Bacteroidota bacterium]